MLSIAFIGLSHLGINYSLATAAKGHRVLAYDPDPDLCGKLSEGQFPIQEPGLMELHAAHKERIAFSSNLSALKSCSLAFFSLDIQTDDENRSDLQPLEKLIESVLPCLSKDCPVVILSQVTPGFTRCLAGRIRKDGVARNAPLYYQVETLIFGRAVERALKPERYIVGCADPSKPLPASYQKWLDSFGCPILPMRYESAELAKIAINMFLVSSVSTTNTLAELCEKIGADWSEIVPALRLDERIGRKAYLTPGLGLSGGNLERDLVTVTRLANEQGTDSGIVRSWIRNSHHRRDWVLKILREELSPLNAGEVIGVWGIAYKSNTHSIKNSPSVDLIKKLPTAKIQAYDPQATLPDDLATHVEQKGTALEACRDASALLVMTPWDEFSKLDLNPLDRLMKGRLIIDPHGVLPMPACLALGFRYYRLGTMPSGTAKD